MVPARRAEAGVVGTEPANIVGAVGASVSTVMVSVARPTPRPGTVAVAALSATASPSGSITFEKVTVPPVATVLVTGVPPPMVSVTTVPTGASLRRVMLVVPVRKTCPDVGAVNDSVGGLPTSIVHAAVLVAALPAGSVAVRLRLVIPASKRTPMKRPRPPADEGAVRVSVEGIEPERERVSVTG